MRNNQNYPLIQNKLRINRNYRGLTQKEIAKILGVSYSQISKWERGVRLPSLRHSLSLSFVYRKLVNDLFWDLYQEQKQIISKTEKTLKIKI